MSTLLPNVIQALQEAELIHKHDRLCDLAAIDAIPIELLQILTLNNQISIARQSTTAEIILVILATSEYKEVRLSILKHLNITVAVLNILSEDEDSQIRKLARSRLKNIRSSFNYPEYLRKLSQDKQGIVLCQVAGNLSTPVDVLALRLSR